MEGKGDTQLYPVHLLVFFFLHTSMTHQLIIIGAGPGGYEVAVRAAKEGLSVLVAEARAVGGTCLNEGCIPTKCLCRSAELFAEINEASSLGIEIGESRFQLATAVARKDAVVAQLATGIRTLMKTPDITFIEGKAEFVDAHTIRIGDAIYSAPHIIIATGSVTKFLPIPGAHAPGVVTSTEMLQLAEVPAHLCIIGGGVIGLEFASIFNAIGSEVTVVEYCKEILPAFDKDLAKRLRTSLKKKGITFKTGAAVTAIHQADTLLSVEFEDKGRTAQVEADLVLMAVGRAANVASLNLADVGIAFTPRGIKVDENMQTNIPGVYAVGDVNGLCQLAHAATFQSYRALNHLLGRTDDICLDIVPAAVFTTPEAAMVGLTEEEATARNIAFTTRKAFYRANGKALAMGAADDGLVKLIIDNEERIIGCHILGAHASDLIHEAAMLIKQQTPLSALKDCIHAHPTLSEILLNAAEG